MIIYSLLFLVYSQQKQQGGSEGLQLFFYKHFLLKFEALEVRVNISLYDTCSRA